MYTILILLLNPSQFFNSTGLPPSLDRILIWLNNMYKKSLFDTNFSPDPTQFSTNSTSLPPFLDQVKLLPNKVSRSRVVKQCIQQIFATRTLVFPKICLHFLITKKKICRKFSYNKKSICHSLI